MSAATPEPSARPPLVRSTALVAVDRPAHVAKELASHFGRRTPADEVPGGYRLHFPLGRVFLSAAEGGLALAADAPDEDALSRVESLVGGRLQSIAPHELAIEWRRQ
ncbi:DUF2218 domain-containing protein [Glycomyces harbinensis]|uniref:DUF2218 domain-containing protein n=1 Tax=Glycomyces harbinensis TaxID=58114 RepID=A0A1G7BY23_9ACTN|nr:DUF2218 domain-containing protein [Glycomyces harbinensis]SDE31939.1 hypothetical protein SAMN05216270_11840 [Glycomyces harbinensis]